MVKNKFSGMQIFENKYSDPNKFARPPLRIKWSSPYMAQCTKCICHQICNINP